MHSLRRRFYGAIAFSILSLNEIRKVPRKSQRQRETRKIACVRTLRPSHLHWGQAILPRHRVPGPVHTAYVHAPRPAAPALFAHRGAVAVHRRYAPRALRPMGEPLLFCFRRPPVRASALTRVAALHWSFVLVDGWYVELYAWSSSPPPSHRSLCRCHGVSSVPARAWRADVDACTFSSSHPSSSSRTFCFSLDSFNSCVASLRLSWRYVRASGLPLSVVGLSIRPHHRLPRTTTPPPPRRTPAHWGLSGAPLYFCAPRPCGQLASNFRRVFSRPHLHGLAYLKEGPIYDAKTSSAFHHHRCSARGGAPRQGRPASWGRAAEQGVLAPVLGAVMVHPAPYARTAVPAEGQGRGGQDRRLV